MKERGIIMSGENPARLLDGRKTQTRRIVKTFISGSGFVQPMSDGSWEWSIDGGFDSGVVRARCPYGVAGDWLYIKETHWRYGKWVKNGRTKTGRQKWRFWIRTSNLAEVAFNDKPPDIRLRPRVRTLLGWHKRPAIFLPKKLARIIREITGVRVERLQDISEEDASAEGISAWDTSTWLGEEDDGRITSYEPEKAHPGRPHFRITKRTAYATLWDSLHGKGAWELNPWVWVLGLKKL